MILSQDGGDGLKSMKPSILFVAADSLLNSIPTHFAG
jgi:hypothetical protein